MSAGVGSDWQGTICVYERKPN